ncbi:radical SAM protein [Phycisphaerales bacterium AB-hyl4]|uniref:Radical SAM protein n=1 Tax=Natronomicrosphaera hydrolytica TaxID=3242702 RepID=A0ABV4U9E3_9BACT
MTRTDTLAQALNIDAVVEGKARLSFADALRLYHEAPLHDLGRWANAVAERIHGTEVRTYVIDRNINYTNVCTARCTFCAFKRRGDEDDAYTLDRETLHRKIAELVAIGGTQILLQGGMNPDLPIEFYEEMLRAMKADFPQVHIHGFSPPEITELVAIAEIDGFPTTAPRRSGELPQDVWEAKCEAIIKRLMAAGLDSLPGGGGEIFADHVRRRTGQGKASAEHWLTVMRLCHKLGLHTSATMMFGHIEGIADRIDHMQRLRDAQDQAINHNWPARYVSFISWPFQRENTPLGRLPEYDVESDEPFAGDVLAEKVYAGEVDGMAKAACDAAVPEAGKIVRRASANEYLRMQAISRLFLDNFHSIGSSWVTMGPKIGQMGLYFGASDMGSVMMEENVVSAAGTTYCLNEEVLCHLIRDAGYTPAQRDNRYNVIKLHNTNTAPDRKVTDWSQHRAKKLHIESTPCDSNEPDNNTPITLTINR